MRILERFRADIERRQLRDLDPVLFLVTLALVICGLVVIYSATRSLPGVPHPHYYVQRQAQWAVLGLLAGIAVLGYDYRVTKMDVRPVYRHGRGSGGRHGTQVSPQPAPKGGSRSAPSVCSRASSQ